jgi:hypothetical protein
MDSALFYEIVVPRPWHERSEYDAYEQTIEQAILSDAGARPHARAGVELDPALGRAR